MQELNKDNLVNAVKEAKRGNLAMKDLRGDNLDNTLRLISIPDSAHHSHILKKL